MGRRRRGAAALTLVCALGLLVAPGAGTQAYATPARPTPRPAMPTVAPPPVVLPPGAPPLPHGEKPYQPAGPGAALDDTALDAVRQRLATLYRQAEAATDAYDLAAERTAAQSAEIVRLTQDLAAGQVRLAELKRRAGAAVRAQYRDGGVPGDARFLLTDDPQAFLDGLGRLRNGQRAQQHLITQLTDAQADLKTYAQDAAANWRRLEASRQAEAKAKDDIAKRIAAARTLESGLEAKQRARLAELEREQADEAQAAWLRSVPLAVRGGPAASASGARAVAFARAQLGKPYVWGAAGPSSYDCSGLTSQAWAAAGRPIPRTSQEQWRRLPHVALADLRPGDLIVYYADASHVGMYVGGGLIVEAPRPGRNVTVAGAGSMPVLGAVRPDA